MPSVRFGHHSGRGRFLFLVTLLATSLSAQTPPCPSGSTPPYVCTSQYDNLRDGYNGNETVLTTTLVGGGLTQPSWSPLTVDQDTTVIPSGYTSNPIYGQPLYVPGISLLGNSACGTSPTYTCNMIVAGTLSGSVWAWNADTGSMLWKRVGKSGSKGTNHLWADDCGATGGVSISSVGGTGSVPFAGIVSTPAIDTNGSTPVMYVTSLCQNASAQPQWWLHKINLTTGSDISTIQFGATVGGTTGADDYSSGSIAFPAGEVLQRSALLEVRNSYATPGVLVYVAFGSANNEAPAPPGQPSVPYKYHGWLFADYTDGSGVLAQDVEFNSSGLGCGTPSSGYYTSQCPGNSAGPSCDCQIELLPGSTTNYFQGAPNWGGHGSGIWMYSRGPASNTLGSGSSQVAHVYATTGNGGFQTYTGSAPYSQPFNLGSSILDFTMSASGIDGHGGSSPAQTFTPYGGAPYAPPLTTTSVFPNFLGTVCNGGASCSYSFQSMNENDWDMGPITLFKDTVNSKNWLASIDKSGYGYLLPQGGFCSPAPCQAFSSGDSPNWPFGAAFTPCWNISGGAANCDKITSLAFYNNELYFWPTNERLTAFAMSDNSTAHTGAGSVYVFSAYPNNVYGCSSPPCTPSCASGGTCFTDEVIPGDTVTIGSQTATVTSVSSDAFLTVNASLSPVTGSGFTYKGYLLNPARDTTPVGSNVDYPGGGVVITSNGSSNGIVWALATVSNTASLYAYNAAPQTSGNARYLSKLWNSTDSTFSLLSSTGATFALPTVVDGAAYVPTYSITKLGSTVSGILVYCGTGAPACN